VVSNRYGALASSEAVLSVSFVAAWGDNAHGQTVVPGGLTNVVAIAGGWWHSLALRGRWHGRRLGSNSDGQNQCSGRLTNVVAIAARSSHNLALRADGTVVAWGDNYYGQSEVSRGSDERGGGCGRRRP